MKFIIIATLLGFSFSSFAETKVAASTVKKAEAKVVEKKMQVNCPILGEAVDKSVYADYKGKRVYFCCAGCIEKFKQDPEKIIKKMESEGITLDKTPK